MGIHFRSHCCWIGGFLLSVACAGTPVTPESVTDDPIVDAGKPAPVVPDASVASSVGPSWTEICTSNPLLLSRYEPNSLLGKPLPEPCCAEGVLPKPLQYRCRFDWPLGEQFGCRVWKELVVELSVAAADSTFMGGLDTTQQKRLHRAVFQILEWYSSGKDCVRRKPPFQEFAHRRCTPPWFNKRLQTLRSALGGYGHQLEALGDHPAYREIQSRGKQCLQPLLMHAALGTRRRPHGPRIHQAFLKLPEFLLDRVLEAEPPKAEWWMQVMRLAEGERMGKCERRRALRKFVTESRLKTISLANKHKASPRRQPIRQTCRQALNGARPLRIHSKICSLFGKRKLRWPVKEILELGIGGYALRPCIEYVVKFGLQRPDVRTLVADEIQGSPLGGFLRSYLSSGDPKLLRHFVPLTRAHRKRAQEKRSDSEEPLGCLGVELLDEMESQGKLSYRGKRPKKWNSCIAEVTDRVKRARFR